MATLYIHIGQPKTGTSALQRFMAQNRSVLERNGCCYPDFGITYPDISNTRNGHFIVAQNCNERDDKENFEIRLINRCMKKIVELSKIYNKIVLSDERIWRSHKLMKNCWENILNHTEKNGIEIKVVVYLRRQDYFAQSFWAQKVKMTATETFEEYINNKNYKFLNLNYYNNLQKIAGKIGKDKIAVRVYEKGINVISDFFDVAELELTDEYANPTLIKNLSLSGKFLEVKRILNGFERFNERDSFMVPLLVNLEKKDGTEVSFQQSHCFSTEEQKEFMSRFEEDNSKIAREFLGREDGVLFYKDTTTVVDKSDRIELSKEEVAGILGDAIVLQHEKILEQQAKLNSLRKALAGRPSNKELSDILGDIIIKQQKELDGSDVKYGFIRKNSFLWRLGKKIKYQLWSSKRIR